MVRNTDIKKDKAFCFRCYHTWNKRKEQNPKSCPKCNSPYWNRPRKKINKKFVIKIEETIINLHKAIIELSGGLEGVREEGGIYNSTCKFLSYQSRHPKNPTGLGAFIINEFAKRHHFNDGNKRTAYAVAKIFMLVNRCHLRIEFGEATTFLLEVAKDNSKITFEEIKKWLDDNCSIIEEKEVENYLNKVFVSITLRGNNDGKL